MHVSPKTEITCILALKNAGFVFVVEINDFSVSVYNFYSYNKYIVVELSFVQRN